MHKEDHGFREQALESGLSQTRSAPEQNRVAVQFWISGFKSQSMTIRELWFVTLHPVILGVALIFGPTLTVLALAPAVIQILVAIAMTLFAGALGFTGRINALVAPSLLLNTVIGGLVIHLGLDYLGSFEDLSQRETLTITLPLTAFYAVMAEFVYYLVYRYVVPTLIARRRQKARAAQSTPHKAVDPDTPMIAPLPKDIVIGSFSVEQTDIVLLEAQANYLRIVWSGGERTERATISTAIDAIDDGLGFQPHRSYWVAFQAIKGYIRSEGKIRLVLARGDEVRVARSQQPAFMRMARKMNLKEL